MRMPPFPLHAFRPFTADEADGGDGADGEGEGDRKLLENDADIDASQDSGDRRRHR